MEEYQGSIHMQYYYEGLRKNKTKPRAVLSAVTHFEIKFSGICSCFTNEVRHLTGILSSLGLNSNHKIIKKR